MKWYRVTVSQAGRRLKPVELAAHDASDAVYCAIVKTGLAGSDSEEDGEVQIVDIDCIEDPEHAKAARRVKQAALRGFAELSEQLGELAKTRGQKSEGP